MKKKFDKIPKTVSQQVKLMIERNIIIEDIEKIEKFLLINNYYKLAAYWKTDANKNNHTFDTPISIDYYIGLYNIDRKVSSFILKYISIAEDIFKTQYAYELAVSTGQSHPHLSHENYNGKNYEKSIEIIKNSYLKYSSNNKIKKHYEERYEEDLPPIWVLTEMITLGSLINLMTDTKYELIKKFYDKVGLKRKTMDSVLKHTIRIRNLCAHNSVIWSQNHTKDLIIPENTPNIKMQENDYIYNYIVLLYHVLKQFNSEKEMENDFKELLSEIDCKLLNGYGFNNIKSLQ